jgi:hypothetical protein
MLLAEDARKAHTVYGVYTVSVFAAESCCALGLTGVDPPVRHHSHETGPTKVNVRPSPTSTRTVSGCT